MKREGIQMEINTQLTEYINEYINFIDIKQESKVGYRKILMEYARYVNKLSDLPTRQDVMNYREYLKTRLKAASVQKHIVVIRNFYRWFYIEGYGMNIADGIKGMRIESDFKREALSIKDSKKLLKRAKFLARSDIIGLRNYALISVLLTTGMRTIEVERADVEDIVYVADSYVLYVMGKGHDDKDTYVKLSPQVYDILLQYMAERSDEFKPLFINHGHTNRGERMRTRSIRGVVKEYLRQIGIDNPKYSAHSLRHTAATISLLVGGGIEDAQRLLRHKDLSTTKIYVHKINKTKGNLENKISDELFENASGK